MWALIFILSALCGTAFSTKCEGSGTGLIEVKSSEVCPNGNNKVRMILTKDSKDKKIMKIEMDLSEDFNAANTFEFVADKWSGTEYKKRTIVIKGQCCEQMNKQIPEFAKKVYSAAKIDGNCDIKKGKRSFEMYVVENDLGLKDIPYGEYKITLKIANAAKAEVACVSAVVKHCPK